MKLLAILFSIALVATFSAVAMGSTYNADFTETQFIPGVEQPLILYGSIAFEPGRRLRWTISKPYHYMLVIQGGRIHENLPDGTVHNVPLDKKPWASVLFDLFSGLFSGKHGVVNRYFAINSDVHGFTLVPRSRTLAQFVSRIVVVGKPLPDVVTIDEASGGRIVLRFEVRLPLPVKATESTSVTTG